MEVSLQSPVPLVSAKADLPIRTRAVTDPGRRQNEAPELTEMLKVRSSADQFYATLNCDL